MFFAVRNREADKIGSEVRAARIRLDCASHELVKTLDEMLEETNKANARRAGAPYNVQITDTKQNH